MWERYHTAARSKFDLKKFRKAVAVLKSKGIIKNVDARNAQPFFIRQGKTLKETVKKFDDVVSGKVEPVTLPPEKVKAYKQAGYETYSPRKGDIHKVLVPKSANEKVSIEKGEIKITEKSGKIERIKKAVPFHNLEQWVKEMMENRLRINAMKRRSEWFGYKIVGHTSWTIYRTIEQLFEDLINGTMSAGGQPLAERYPTRKTGNEFFEALEIVRIPRPDAWPSPPPMRRIPFRQRTGRRPMSPLTLERKREKDRIKHQKWRAQLTKKEKEKYNLESRKRANKWHKKHKRKK